MNTPNAARRIKPAGLKKLFSRRRVHTLAASLWLLSLIMFRQPLSGLTMLSLHDQRSSHVLLIPFISALLIFLQRKRVFCAPRYCPSIGVPLFLIVALLWQILQVPITHLNETDHLSVLTSLIVVVWIAGFILFYGIRAFKAAAFPLLFLLLMIPIPVALAEKTVSILQRGSADACYGLFRLVGVPFIRHGFQFSLPGVDIEVAEQCSGIHSALSLFVAGLLLQHILLKGNWKKVLFSLCIFPIAIFKNAVRIVTITWLGIHVNSAFFYGQLHHQGGLPFSILAIALLAVLIWVLRGIGPLALFEKPERSGPVIPPAVVPAK